MLISEQVRNHERKLRKGAIVLSFMYQMLAEDFVMNACGEHDHLDGQAQSLDVLN